MALAFLETKAPRSQGRPRLQICWLETSTWMSFWTLQPNRLERRSKMIASAPLPSCQKIVIPRMRPAVTWAHLSLQVSVKVAAVVACIRQISRVQRRLVRYRRKSNRPAQLSSILIATLKQKVLRRSEERLWQAVRARVPPHRPEPEHKHGRDLHTSRR